MGKNQTDGDLGRERKILRLVEAFEDIFADVEVRHPANVVASLPDNASVAATLGSATTKCLPLNQQICADICLQCDHFIGTTRHADGSLELRCWSHRTEQRRIARGTKRFRAVKLGN